MVLQIAVNYPARKFGITRHMDVSVLGLASSRKISSSNSESCVQVNEAKKRCPHLQTVHVATCE